MTMTGHWFATDFAVETSPVVEKGTEYMMRTTMGKRNESFDSIVLDDNIHHDCLVHTQLNDLLHHPNELQSHETKTSSSKSIDRPIEWMSFVETFQTIPPTSANIHHSIVVCYSIEAETIGEGHVEIVAEIDEVLVIVDAQIEHVPYAFEWPDHAMVLQYQ